MISLEEVRAQILERIAPLEASEIGLEEAAGRTLAEDVSSADPIPPFDNSAMDGFALRRADLERAAEEAPRALRVVFRVEAGSEPARAIGAGEAARITTGAPLPPGADCIVPFERAAAFDDDSVTVAFLPASGAHVRRLGEEIAAGDIVLQRGTRLTPAAVGLLATVGRSRVRVGRRPRVAVHSSGDELIPVAERLAPGKIRNSNLYSLSARIGEWGALPLPRPTLRDTPEETRAGLRQTLALRPDAIVTTGGISAGDLDFVREVARELGDDTRVRRVSMKPGKPLVDGTIAGVPFFGLPGNPAACLVSFEMFVRPALARMEGRGDGLLPRRRARIREGRRFPHGGRLQLLRGIVRHDADTAEYTLEPLRSQGSHLLSSFAGANCLVEIPAHVSELRAGEMVSVLLL